MHRDAYNQVFAEFGVDTYWSKEQAAQERLNMSQPLLHAHVFGNGWKWELELALRKNFGLLSINA